MARSFVDSPRRFEGMTGLATVEFVEDNDMEREQKYPREWDGLSFLPSVH